MILRRKPYAKVSDSGVDWLGEIPSHWRVRRLRALADISTGARDTIEQDADGQYPFFVRSQNVARIDTWSFDGEAVLTAGDGDVGRVFHYINGKFDYHQRVYKLSDFNGIQGRFFFHYFRSMFGHEVFQGTAKSTVESLRLPMLQNFPVAVPSVTEQTAVARFLDHATSRIERYTRARERQILLLDEQRRGMVHEAVTGLVDVSSGKPYEAYKPSGVKWLGNVPAHWDVRPGKWHLREVDERSVTGAEEMLSVSHLTGVTPRSEKSVTMFQAESNVGHKLCEPGDLVVNTMWAWMGALGVAQQPGLVSPSYAVYRPMSDSSLDSRYAEMLLRSAPLRCEYIIRSTGIRPSRLRLYPDTFLRIRLVAPPPDEQSAIVAFVASERARFDRVAKLMAAEVTALSEYRARLVADVVTGKLDVRQAAADMDERFITDGTGKSKDGADPGSGGTQRAIAMEDTP